MKSILLLIVAASAAAQVSNGLKIDNATVAKIVRSSVAAARNNREDALSPCKGDAIRKEALCIVQACGLCEKFKQAGDTLERFACPQPLGLAGDGQTPEIIFEAYRENNQDRVTVCRMSRSDAGGLFEKVFGSACDKLISKSSLPKFGSKKYGLFGSRKLQCGFNQYWLVPNFSSAALMNTLDINSAHAMHLFGLKVDAQFQGRFDQLMHQQVSPINFGQLAVVQQVAPSMSHSSSIHTHQTSNVIAPTAETSVEIIEPEIDTELIAQHQQNTVIITEKTKLHAEAVAAAQEAQTKLNAAQTAASQANAAKVAAERTLSTASSAFAMASQRLTQAKAAIQSGEAAVDKATTAKTSAEGQLEAAMKAKMAADETLASVRASAQSLSIASATASAEMNAVIQMQNELSVKLNAGTRVMRSTTNVVSGAVTGGSSTTMAMSQQGGAVVPMVGVAGVAVAGGAVVGRREDGDDDEEEGAKPADPASDGKEAGGYKEPWWTFHAGTLQYWIIILLFVGGVMLYFVLG